MSKAIYPWLPLALILPLAACSSDSSSDDDTPPTQQFERLVAKQADICGTSDSRNGDGRHVVTLSYGRQWPSLYIPYLENCGVGGTLRGWYTVTLDSVPEGFRAEEHQDKRHPTVFYGRLFAVGHIDPQNPGTEVTDSYRMKVDSVAPYKETSVRVATDMVLTCKAYADEDGVSATTSTYRLIPTDKSALPEGVADNEHVKAYIWTYNWPDNLPASNLKTYQLKGHLYRTREHFKQNEKEDIKAVDYRLDITEVMKAE